MVCSSDFKVGICQLKVLFKILALTGFVLAPSISEAAINYYAELTLDSVALDGDTTLQEMGGIDVGTNHLECTAINLESYLGDAGPTAALLHTPIKIIKRIDKATPLLVKALQEGQTVEGEIKFFHPDPSGTGAIVHYFSLIITGGRISGVRNWQPNNLDPAVANWPFVEEISIQFTVLTFNHVTSGTSYDLRVEAP